MRSRTDTHLLRWPAQAPLAAAALIAAMAAAQQAPVTVPPPAPAPSPPPAQTLTDITFLDDMAAAQLIAQQQSKLIVVQFGATWCGWCRRMERDTFSDDRVRALANDFAWVKVDIDEQPDVASAHRVRGVPHTVIINSAGQRLASHVGYMPAAEFVNFVRSALDAAESITTQQPAATPDLNQTITGLVDAMAKAQRGARQPLVDAIAALGEPAWPLLCDRMNDERLSTRAAAYTLLAAISDADLPFDPFAPASLRQDQINAWRVWLEAHAAAATPKPPAPASDDEKAQR